MPNEGGRNKMLNRRTRMNNENCKNKRREAKKICTTQQKETHDLKVLAGMEESKKRNEGRKFHTISGG
jgi:hypothetical protein